MDLSSNISEVLPTRRRRDQLLLLLVPSISVIVVFSWLLLSYSLLIFRVLGLGFIFVVSTMVIVVVAMVVMVVSVVVLKKDKRMS